MCACAEVGSITRSSEHLLTLLLLLFLAGCQDFCVHGGRFCIPLLGWIAGWIAGHIRESKGPNFCSMTFLASHLCPRHALLLGHVSWLHAARMHARTTAQADCVWLFGVQPCSLCPKLAPASTGVPAGWLDWLWVGWDGYGWWWFPSVPTCLPSVFIPGQRGLAGWAGHAREPRAEGTRDLLLGTWYGVVCVDGPA
jgi:hypothetical protein